MKLRFKQFALLIVTLNLSLVVITILLSQHSTFKHPMIGTLHTAGEHQLHAIDSSNPDNIGAIDNDKPTVVLIHGASTSALDFSTNLHPLLSANWRVVSVDRPGHGYSDRGNAVRSVDPARQATMILDALHSMGIENPVLIGHSWAGSVVMAALLLRHEHVKPIAGVLIAGATHPWEGESAWHVELSAKPVIGTLFRWQYIAPMGRLLMLAAIESVFAPEKVPEGYIENTGLSLSLRPTTYKHNALDISGLSNYLETQSIRYQDIMQPLLSIAATEDQVVPAWNHHDRLRKQLRNLQTLEIPDAGHAPHHTQTTLVADTIEAFIRSLE